MLKCWLLFAAGCVIASAMLYLDRAAPTELFYTALQTSNQLALQLYRFKKIFETSLSLLLILLSALVVRRRKTQPFASVVAGVWLGFLAGFWTHRDLLYLLLH